jgi:hypothetical protein
VVASKRTRLKLGHSKLLYQLSLARAKNIVAIQLVCNALGFRPLTKTNVVFEDAEIFVAEVFSCEKFKQLFLSLDQNLIKAPHFSGWQTHRKM